MPRALAAGELLLGGGGDADDSAPVDARLVEAVGGTGTIGYVPHALPRSAFDDCEAWLRETLGRHGDPTVETWRSLESVDAETLAAVDAVYVGGGNTYDLLDELRSAALLEPLRAYVRDGGVLYGGSAGAILCGPTIETTPDENAAGVTDERALDLTGGVDVWCHYEPADDAAVGEYVETTERPVVALPERGGVAVTAEGFEAVGHEPVAVFTQSGRTRLDPGATWTRE